MMHIWCKQRSKGASEQDVPLTRSAALLQSAFDPESLGPPRPPARSAWCQADTSGRSAGPARKQSNKRVFFRFLVFFVSVPSVGALTQLCVKIHDEYLFFGDVELTSNDPCYSQSTFRARQHGCEAVKSLAKKTPINYTGAFSLSDTKEQC